MTPRLVSSTGLGDRAQGSPQDVSPKPNLFRDFLEPTTFSARTVGFIWSYGLRDALDWTFATMLKFLVSHGGFVGPLEQRAVNAFALSLRRWLFYLWAAPNLGGSFL